MIAKDTGASYRVSRLIDELIESSRQIGRQQGREESAALMKQMADALENIVAAADGGGWKVLSPSLEKQRAALAAYKDSTQ